jgi:hypothetical protein
MPIVIQAVSLESSQNCPPSSPLEYNLTKKSLSPYVQVRSYSSSTGNSNSGPRLSHADRKAIDVTVEQHEVIVGSLLGDMCAVRPTPKRNCRVSIIQSNLPSLLNKSLSPVFSAPLSEGFTTLYSLKGEPGIYCISSKEGNTCYVGSSLDIYKRCSSHFLILLHKFRDILSFTLMLESMVGTVCKYRS